NATARALLDEIKDHNKREAVESPYWFQTPSGRYPRSITSVDAIWRRTLQCCRMKYYPLREFARSFREPNCPSYYANFLRQYGPFFRRTHNVAELSKRLCEVEKRPAISMKSD